MLLALDTALFIFDELLAAEVTLAAIPATVVTSLDIPATVVVLAAIPATVVTLLDIPATVVTSVAFGTNLWNAYVCNVDVVSTITPKPDVRTVDPQPVIVTSLPDPAPFVIVTVPLLGVRVLDID